MKNVFTTAMILVMVSLFSVSVFASYQSQDLSVTEARFIDTSLMKDYIATLNTNKENGPISITLSWMQTQMGQLETMTLPITSVSYPEQDNNDIHPVGVTTSDVYYFANSSSSNGSRVGISIYETTIIGCFGEMSRTWTVTLRRGYGWCGTGDEVLTLQGNAHFIQQ